MTGDEGEQLHAQNSRATVRRSWAARYVGIAVLLTALCIPAIWYYGGYKQADIHLMLSYKVDDGWCTKGPDSIGAHCFGDFAGVNTYLEQKLNFWAPKGGIAPPTAYPPLSMAPPVAFVYLGRWFDNFALGRNLYLALLAASLLTPAFWVARKRWWERGPTAFLILGLASAPFIINLDRGNNTALVVAPLFAAALAFIDGKHNKMLVFLILSALIKPQMLLFAFLFLVYRKYAHLILAFAVTSVLTVAGFLFYPGSFFDNFHNWIDQFRDQSHLLSVAGTPPANLGIGRSMVILYESLHLGGLFGGGERTHFAIWLQDHTTLTGAIVVALMIAMIYRRRPESNLLYPLIAACALITIAPGTSQAYYTAVFLIPGAFLLRDPRTRHARGARGVALAGQDQWSGMLEDEDGNGSAWYRACRWIVVAGLALLLSPLVIPVSSFSFLDTHSGDIGVVQYFWGPIALAVFLAAIALAVRRPSRPAPEHHGTDALTAGAGTA